MPNPIKVVQGGQYGSEAKGAITAYLCEKDKVDYCVRTGATNAGHTVYYQGKPYAMQQLGVGWINPNTALVIGAGALIDPEILDREVAVVSHATGEDITKRLIIDYRAGVHLRNHQQRSAESGRHHRIGATGKGCSEALIDRIRNRGRDGLLYKDVHRHQYDLADTEALLNRAYDDGATILLEGTQGQLLDLYLGPYPYTTHKQTGPAQWMLECGLSPSLPTEITMVVRTFPIRVAGNSGPLKDEISWSILAGEINGKRRANGLPPLIEEEALAVWHEALDVASRSFKFPHGRSAHDQHQWHEAERATFDATLSELNASAWRMLPEPIQQDLRKLFELTTVTKKLRRIARFNQDDYSLAVRQVRPHKVALTFANYLHPEHWFEVPSNPEDLPHADRRKPDLMSFGPESKHIIDLR